MTHSFKLSRRIARLRGAGFAALVLAFAGCDSTESFDPDSSTPPQQEAAAPAQPAPLASIAFAGGIPFGHFAQPTSEYGARFNGGHKNVAPQLLLGELAAIKARGGKVLLMFAGSERYYKEGGHFSLTKWKERVNRYKGLNLTSYINDGTIIGHYMLDEPNDPANWNGKTVPPSVLEEMGRYSKQLWPGMATIVRVVPSYLDMNHRYVDAAWAQYLARKGNVGDFIRENVADAQRRGLALAVGLNVLHGGTPTGTKMTATEVASWGAALLSSTYPCAFISWTYNSSYLASSDIKNAMDELRRKAESRGSKSCRGG
jgi:hypothetical protein